MRITVRRVRGDGGRPDGAVSTYLHEHVTEDETLLLGPPAGDTALDAGARPTRPVVLAHADRSPAHHALRRECAQIATGPANARELRWYENDPDAQARPGRMDVD